MSSSRSEFVQEAFREYYKSSVSLANLPSLIDRREFGFILFLEGMIRHKKFANGDELSLFLQKFSPSDAYYSCAYYENPEAEMDKKGWLGADLLFDIDADHISTPCDKVHDKWLCGACGFTGKGVAPEKCPVCGKEKLEVNTWPCEICLGSAKEETVKLLDMLMRDFGFSEKEIHVFFSGHRGYHVHVESELVQTLDAVARKEIVDYFSGLELGTSFYGLNEKPWKAGTASGGSRLDDFGWRKRLMLGMQNFVRNAEEDDLRKIGLSEDIVETIMRNKESILRNWLRVGAWDTVKGVGLETWRKITEHVVKLESVKVDTVVTTDIHRLIRLAGTLHGKTGFKKVEFPASTIDEFDPFRDGVAFERGTVRVFASDSPAFRMGEETFGPYKDQKVELPTAAAVLLICKGRAEVVN